MATRRGTWRCLVDFVDFFELGHVVIVVVVHVEAAAARSRSAAAATHAAHAGHSAAHAGHAGHAAHALGGAHHFLEDGADLGVVHVLHHLGGVGGAAGGHFLDGGHDLRVLHRREERRVVHKRRRVRPAARRRLRRASLLFAGLLFALSLFRGGGFALREVCGPLFFALGGRHFRGFRFDEVAQFLQVRIEINLLRGRQVQIRLRPVAEKPVRLPAHFQGLRGVRVEFDRFVAVPDRRRRPL
mmetsp:Transcript_16933/g.51370  ORF Transcript_16933/g.51370 Transcript_16933/m.51370 type:complete len:242 (+) Transcript_16933:318-1043(+)